MGHHIPAGTRYVAGTLSLAGKARKKVQMAERVLIVEDQFLVAIALQSALQDAGYDVLDPVSTGDDALERVRNGRVDWAILDVNINGSLDGVTTARRIRTLQPVHLLFVSGYADATMREDVRDLRPAAVLTKPVAPDEIVAVIEGADRNRTGA